MKFIELDALPKELEAAILTDHYTDPNDKPSDYSATKLIAPIQQTELRRRYAGTGKLVPEDVLDNFNAWVGSVIHNAIEAAWKKDMGSIVEERFYMTFGDKVVSGKVDCLSNNAIIDWKTCRTYKVVKGDVSEWEKQANIYALLAEEAGYKIDKLHIYAIVLDLKKAEAQYKKDLPNKPVVRFDLRRWENEEIKNYIENRISLLKYAETLSDDELFQKIPCTKKEQWSELKDVSIFKKGSERAAKVCASREEAEQVFRDNPKFTEDTHEIRDRYKPRTRCLNYCSCKTVCKQFAAEQEEQQPSHAFKKGSK